MKIYKFAVFISVFFFFNSFYAHGQSVTGINLDKTKLIIFVGQTENLNATIAPANATNKAVTWSTNNGLKLSVDTKGMLTARAAGEAVITVTSQDGGKTAQCSVKIYPANFVRINGGTFTMGSPESEPEREDDETQRSVTISSFYMCKYHVTQAEYQTIMGNNPSVYEGPNLPVNNITWFEAIDYCNKLSKKDGLEPVYTVTGIGEDRLVSWNRDANGYRLPTEAEWEFACRAGTKTPFSTGNNINTRQANYNGKYPYNNNAIGTYLDGMLSVGSFTANPWGLYDMHGNANEWCWDWYDVYPIGAQTDPQGVSYKTEQGRVVRGGSFSNSGSELRSANRSSYKPNETIPQIGFRVVRN